MTRAGSKRENDPSGLVTKAAYRVPFLAQAAGGEIDFLLSQHGAIPNPRWSRWGGRGNSGLLWDFWVSEKIVIFCCGIFVMGNIVNPRVR